MTIQQLEYVVALDNQRHFVKAAQKSFITQPTLTMQLKKLEDEIGLQIFDRSKAPLKPTKTGEQFISKAREIIREVNQLKEMVSNEKESIEGSFSLGVIPTIAPYLLPKFLKYFAKKFPKTQLNIKELQTHEIVAYLNRDELDMGILATPLHESSIREIPVYYEPFVLFLPNGHPLMNKDLVSGHEIDAKELLLLGEGHCFREQALEVCSSVPQNKTGGFNYESGSIETIKQMVIQGVGITLIPELAILDETDQKFCKRFVRPEPTREIGIVVHKSFAKEALIECVYESIKQAIPKQMEQKERSMRVKWR
jgi:LysR family transcriptional regulator, hydrogen peroxide-inducible genes activator